MSRVKEERKRRSIFTFSSDGLATCSGIFWLSFVFLLEACMLVRAGFGDFSLCTDVVSCILFFWGMIIVMYEFECLVI